MSIMQVHDLKKSFTKGPNTIPVLKGINMEVHEGEFLSIIGQSGSGKSTLLHVMGLLTHPDEGEIHYGGERIDNQSERRRDYLRNHDISLTTVGWIVGGALFIAVLASVFPAWHASRLQPVESLRYE